MMLLHSLYMIMFVLWIFFSGAYIGIVLYGDEPEFDLDPIGIIARERRIVRRIFGWGAAGTLFIWLFLLSMGAEKDPMQQEAAQTRVPVTKTHYVGLVL